jgi:hypothetical protein
MIEYLTFTKENLAGAIVVCLDGKPLPMGNNRPVRPIGVNKYTEMMNNGQWRTNDRAQVPLLIDANGVLRGGQHRICAFRKSKLNKITFPVAKNATEDEIQNQDAAIPRNTTDQVVMFHQMPTMKSLTISKVGAIGRVLVEGKKSDPRKVAEALQQYTNSLVIIDEALSANGRLTNSAPFIAAFARTFEMMDRDKWNASLSSFDKGTVDTNSPLALLATLETRRPDELFLKAIHALKSVHKGLETVELTADKDHLTDW